MSVPLNDRCCPNSNQECCSATNDATCQKPISYYRRIARLSIFHVRKQAHTQARHQHLIFRVGDAVADVRLSRLVPTEADRHFAELVRPGLCRLPVVAEFGPQVVVAGRRRLGDGGNIVLREGVQKVDAREPVGVAPE